MMRGHRAAFIVSVCSVAVVLSLLFLYVSEFPFFHQSDVMTVEQLDIGIKCWRSFYEGKNVTVRGTLAPARDVLTFPEDAWKHPDNGMLLDDSLNGTGVMPINLNWTQCSSLMGKDVIVKGMVLFGGSYLYIKAEQVYDARIYYLINAF
jgi:hypothetical protein